MLGVQWQGSVYNDAMLPFGLRSPQKIFMAIADDLEWVIRRRGVQHVCHYIDDFIMCGGAASRKCTQALDTALSVSHQLGVPISQRASDRHHSPRRELESLVGLLNHACKVVRPG